MLALASLAIDVGIEVVFPAATEIDQFTPLIPLLLPTRRLMASVLRKPMKIENCNYQESTLLEKIKSLSFLELGLQQSED